MIATRLAALGCAVLVMSSCSGPTDPSQNQSERFTGSVQPFGAGIVHPFTISNLGEITVSVTAITPGNTFLGIGYGQPNANFCGLIQQNVVSSANLGRTALSGSIIIRGNYCVQVFDPVALTGTPLTVPQNYTLTVSHP